MNVILCTDVVVAVKDELKRPKCFARPVHVAKGEDGKHVTASFSPSLLRGSLRCSWGAVDSV